MGYTVEGKNTIIWTQKVFEADKWPFNHEGENYTYFFKNLRDKNHFMKCLARLSEDEKKKLISEALGIKNIILRSKASHYKLKRKNKTT